MLQLALNPPACHFFVGNLQKAKALSISGIRLAPQHGALWTVAGLTELKLGNTDNARRVLQSGIKINPTHGKALLSNHNYHYHLILFYNYHEGYLYKALGELEVRAGAYEKARSIFLEGMNVDAQCAGLYHAAALLEAKLCNLEGLSGLHKLCKSKFAPRNEEFSNDIIAKIGVLEEAAKGTHQATTRLTP